MVPDIATAFEGGSEGREFEFTRQAGLRAEGCAVGEGTWTENAAGELERG